MRKHTCHLDLRQRSLYVTIGQKELGSKVDRQPEGEVARQAKFFQSTQPIPNPIRDRSGQHGITQDVIVVQDERKTSRSQEISVNSFNEELCSSDRSRQPGITQDVISVQACSSEDSKSLNVEQVIDQGNLITNTKCLLKKAKHPGLERSRRDLLPGLERSRRHLFTKNSVLQIDQGNLISRLA